MEPKSRSYLTATFFSLGLTYLFFLMSCSLLTEWTEEKPLVSNLPGIRIYTNFSSIPASSESFRNQPGHLRYLILQTQSSKEKIWTGEVDLWETKEDFHTTLPKGIVFPKLSFKASLFSGSARLEEGESSNPKHISFHPQGVLSWNWEGEGFRSGMQISPPKQLSVSDWGILYNFSQSGIVWVAKEYRSLGKNVELNWENVRNSRTSLSTDYTSPGGRSFPYADYDYKNQIFQYVSMVEGRLPVWTFREEGEYRWAWGILPEDLLSSKNVSQWKQKRKEEFVSIHFYDAANNIPFTASADLKNYPIILIKDYDNARK
ncbi:hypothetical protein EHQ81_05310 [Leptospira selangorensis]|uniref:Lipoprotein n=1 Tax=Leptospira selangorensis TaxID=2484982 RepID=A0A5F2BZI6_9LEPT|nr:hypothetical protein [Leptospira selangorensis]TGM15815.1 hypothetical protein EHQ81_05310 [Leptospira selangorensis]TGM18235.1 hypothetical protein EHQ82_14395 [Leptospira selangorensis]